jgi:hypothetical protein
MSSEFLSLPPCNFSLPYIYDKNDIPLFVQEFNQALQIQYIYSMLSSYCYTVQTLKLIPSFVNSCTVN